MPGRPEASPTGYDASQEMAERLWLASKLKVLSPRSSFSMNDAVDAALFLTDRMFRQSGIEVQRNLDPEIPDVDASMGQVEQVLVNVLVNACEATAPGGVVTVETHYAAAARAVEVHVKDTGAGMSEAVLKKAFDPFFSTKGRLGIGLAAARDLLRRSGGDIRIESRAGKGTDVFMAMPAGH